MPGLSSPPRACRDPPRRARLAACLSVLAVLGAHASTVPLSQAPQTAPTIRDLEVGQTLEGVIASGEIHEFHLSLTRGDFVRVVVEQRGVDVALALYRPDRSLLFGRDTESDIFEPELLVAVADVTGTFTLSVRGAYVGRPAGRYAARLEAVRPAVPRDEALIAAQRTFERARDIEATGALSQYPKGIETVTAALDEFRALDARDGELKCLLLKAGLEWLLSRPDAIDTARVAEQMATDLHDDAARAGALRLRGLAVQRTGDLASSLPFYEAALAIYRALGHEQGQAHTLGDIGQIYGRTGDSDRAIARFEESLAIDRRRNDPQQVLALNNLGIAYKNVGEYDKALEAYQEVLRTPTIAGNPSQRALVLNNAGVLQQLLGHDREALALHLQALELARQVGSRDNEARSLNTIGQTYASLGDYDRALQFEQEGLAIRRSLADLPGQAASLTAIGSALQHLGDLDRAYASVTEGLTILRSIREEYSEPDALRSLAVIDRDRGNLPLALERVKAAVDLDEQLRERITSPELRATFVASVQEIYEIYVDLLQQQAALEPGGGHEAEALDVSERGRARVLLESLLDARVDLRQGIDPALLARERSLQKQLSTAATQISRALAKPGAKDPPTDLLQAYERLGGEYQQHLALIRRQSPRYADITQPQPLETAEIQHEVIDPETVLLEFELGRERSWLWALTPTSLTSVVLSPRSEIDAPARALYEALTARQRRAGETMTAYNARVTAADAEAGAKAAALSRMLFGGIAARLDGEWRGKRLVIVAAGSLEYVPFAALPLPEADSRTALGSQHEIVKIPSASVLAALRRESAGRRPASRALAVLADPVFDASDPRVVAAVHGPVMRPPATPGQPEDIDESIYVRSGLSRLPFSREEANAIEVLAGAKNTYKAIDFSASRATVLGGALAGYRIVHFATHGILDSSRPSLSGLVLSLVDDRGQRQDGFVRLPDIYNMRLDADLVVLSACQTALGKDIKGEGLIGLTRAFMYAGTPRVVASLWEVSDLATAELMRKFYAAMLQRHLTAAAALRAAQLEMARDPRWSAPYYWAGFVFEGDWR